MKELNILKGRPLLNYVLTTSDKYTIEECTLKSGIVDNTRLNKLKLYQTIVGLSPRLVNTGLEVGQLVLINIDRYGRTSQKKDSLKQSMDEYYDSVMHYSIPSIEIDHVEYLKIGDNDIDFIIDEHNYEEVQESDILQVPSNTELTKNPSKLILPTSDNLIT